MLEVETTTLSEVDVPPSRDDFVSHAWAAYRAGRSLKDFAAERGMLRSSVSSRLVACRKRGVNVPKWTRGRKCQSP